jgi:glycosyltransferase involved in cell wall biosynthesis
VTVVASVEPEAFGRAAAEALAMGSPVIATNIGALPESMLAEPAVPAHQITGWLVSPNDSKALAARLDEALRLHPEARKAIAARARADAVRRFSVSLMQRQTLAVYDQLLGTRLSADMQAVPNPLD